MKNFLLRIFYILFLRKITFIQRLKSAAFKAYFFPKNNGFFSPDIYIKHAHNIKVGSNCIISECTLGALSEIIIGNNVTISKGAIIETAKLSRTSQNRHSSKPILIGNNVWLGTNCIILGGVKIGDGALVGAGSVVRRDIKPNEVFIGK
tara:strand:+ start:231 stop:677 length:447 start_codon:yes stop_codon:yes gene_type:complete